MDTSAEETLKPRERSDARANRQRLLVVAKALFAVQGVEATTMVEIARAAEVGQGTLYRHFADKRDVCQALIKEDISAFCERLGAVISGTWVIESPLARIDMLLSEKIRLTESHLPLFAEMEASGGTKRAKPARGPFHSWVHEQIVALLQEAIEQGEISELDTAFTADAMLAAVAPPIYSSQRNELGYSSERIIAGIRHLFIDRLRQPKD